MSESKEQIRKVMKIKRRYFQNVVRQASDNMICENFLLAYGDFDSFFIYNSFSDEADTSQIIGALRAAGKRVYLPRVEGDGLAAVEFGECDRGAFGIFEPRGQAFGGLIDVSVIPLLAVNGAGQRIGYGKGFYDRYLKDRQTVKVGIGYSFQIADFCGEEQDVPLDAFVCEKGIYTYATDK